MEITWKYIFAVSAIFAASVIRGYSGFGFAMISAITLSFVFPPTQVTPVILCLEIAASFWLLYKVRKLVDWKGLKILGAGAFITLPLGSMALALAPVHLLRIFISMTIIILCAGLLFKKQRPKTTGTLSTLVVGMLSGFLTVVASIGGPPVILFYFSSNRSVSVSRASMIAFFLVVDILALISAVWYGLLNRQTLLLSAGMLVPLGLGIWTGNAFYGKFASEEAFRKQVLIFLAGLASISFLKTVLWPS